MTWVDTITNKKLILTSFKVVFPPINYESYTGLKPNELCISISLQSVNIKKVQSRNDPETCLP